MTTTEPLLPSVEDRARHDEPVPGTPARWRRWLAGVRLHIVGWHLLLLVAALALSLLAVRAILLARLDERVDRDLVQEVDELRALATGLDPETGEPFAGVQRLFEVFLQRNVPAPNETVVTYVDGRPWRRSAGEPPVRLDLVDELTERWAGLADADRGTVRLAGAGPVDYLAVPVLAGGESRGVFVVAHFTWLEHDGINEILGIAGGIGLVALLLAAGITWNVGTRVLVPVRAVSEAARRITDTDLSQRIEVSAADEVSMLARTFNSMLDRLEAAFASQRAFVDDAGHELRTPITIIRGHLELLDADDPQDRAATVALVLDELARMHRMVEDLLVLAKAQQPDFLRLEVVDVAALTGEVAVKARGLARRDWRVEARGRGTIVADRQRLTEALVQLAENAARHTADGDLIAVGSQVEAGEARLWVRDTGPGVRPGEQRRIFERFVRGEGEARADGGSGLGLAIVRAIAEAHHGRVELDSRPPGGATFTVVVPVEHDGGGPGR